MTTYVIVGVGLRVGDFGFGSVMFVNVIGDRIGLGFSYEREHCVDARKRYCEMRY